MLEIVLKKAGLNDKEAFVYLALLELGSQPASVIGKKAKINRSTTYLILESLIKNGFVNQHIRADVKYFTAADPQVIIKNLEHEQIHIEETKKEFVDLLPEFYSLSNPLSIKPKVRFYDGEEGVKRAIEDTFTSKGPILSWDSVDSWLVTTPGLQKFIKECAKIRSEKIKIPVKVLAPDTATSKQYFLKDYPPIKDKADPLMEIRWIPKEIKPFKNEINIYDDKVSIVSLARNELLGIVIESHEIANTHRSIFELAWKSGKKN